MEDPVQQRQLGDRTVGAIGLGGMPLSIEGRPDEAQAVRTVHAALDMRQRCPTTGIRPARC